jgi:hypothetical protein
MTTMKFMLLLRGDPARFETLSAPQQQAVVARHTAWAQRLAEAGQLVDGGGFAPSSQWLAPGAAPQQRSLVGQADAPNGFYLIQAASEDEALALARECPALGFGDSVELLPVVH